MLTFTLREGSCSRYRPLLLISLVIFLLVDRRPAARCRRSRSRSSLARCARRSWNSSALRSRCSVRYLLWLKQFFWVKLLELGST